MIFELWHWNHTVVYYMCHVEYYCFLIAVLMEYH